jgi:GDP-D-mannose dehydratase
MRNLDTRWGWRFAGDYVPGMWLMLERNKAEHSW